MIDTCFIQSTVILYFHFCILIALPSFITYSFYTWYFDQLVLQLGSTEQIRYNLSILLCKLCKIVSIRNFFLKKIFNFIELSEKKKITIYENYPSIIRSNCKLCVSWNWHQCFFSVTVSIMCFSFIATVHFVFVDRLESSK